MDNKTFEETKKKYEDEIARLKAIMSQTQSQYQQAYNQLEERKEKLLEEYNSKVSSLNIGIERLRGAYTALCDMEDGKDPTLVVNGMMKDVKVQSTEPQVEEQPVAEDVNKDDTVQEQENQISEEVKEKAHALVEEAKAKGKVTKYEDFAKSELGKETAVKDVNEVVEEEQLAKLHQSGETVLSEGETKAVQDLMEKLKDEKATENVSVEASKSTNKETTVNPDDVPDYLKEEYGMKK